MISYYMQDVLAHFSFRTIWCVNSEIQALSYDSQMALNNTSLLALWFLQFSQQCNIWFRSSVMWYKSKVCFSKYFLIFWTFLFTVLSAKANWGYINMFFHGTSWVLWPSSQSRGHLKALGDWGSAIYLENFLSPVPPPPSILSYIKIWTRHNILMCVGHKTNTEVQVESLQLFLRLHLCFQK